MALNQQSLDGHTPTWCPGCGNWAIRVGIKSALEQLGHDPSSLFISFDIGCSGNMNDFVNAYSMHTLHGRSLATAVGMKLANHKMETVVIGGDGATYGEGGNHFLHACRGNHDMTVIVHDNMVYGLTTGQVAPTAEHGYKSKSTPSGMIELPVNPIALAVSQGATFVAQTFAGDVKHVIETVKSAVNHNGFSVVNILQPCVTFNKINTYHYYLEHTYKLSQDYDASNMTAAMGKALELNEEKFPLGIIYQVDRPTYHEQLTHIDQSKGLVNAERFTDIESIVSEFV
jgi:2-oxoglutarate/2-oxoacid ferredoxin oxidoreductase subunit beta